MNYNSDNRLIFSGGCVLDFISYVANPHILHDDWILHVDLTHWLGDLALKLIAAGLLGIVGGASALIGKKMIDRIWKTK